VTFEEVVHLLHHDHSPTPRTDELKSLLGSNANCPGRLDIIRRFPRTPPDAPIRTGVRSGLFDPEADNDSMDENRLKALRSSPHSMITAILPPSPGKSLLRPISLRSGEFPLPDRRRKPSAERSTILCYVLHATTA